jgi:hypothetical protein
MMKIPLPSHLLCPSMTKERVNFTRKAAFSNVIHRPLAFPLGSGTIWYKSFLVVSGKLMFNILKKPYEKIILNRLRRRSF